MYYKRGEALSKIWFIISIVDAYNKFESEIKFKSQAFQLVLPFRDKYRNVSREYGRALYFSQEPGIISTQLHGAPRGLSKTKPVKIKNYP